jgi:hypothetical protein
MSGVKHKRWLILLTIVLILALGVYSGRQSLKRAFIAASIYHAHIFTPPPRIPGESQWHRLRDDAQFYWEFAEIPVARERRLKLLNPF